MTTERLDELITRYLEGKITPAEMKELDSLLDHPSLETRVAAQILNGLHDNNVSTDADLNAFHRKLELTILQLKEQSDSKEQSLNGVLPDGSDLSDRSGFFKAVWLKYAAVFVLATGIGFIIWQNSRKVVDPVAGTIVLPPMQDIPPGGNKAVLLLSDSTLITLDEADEGTIAKQGKASIIKLDNGQIVYTLNGLPQGKPMQNTLITPRGGQFKLTLPDGTLVWLDAESTITYPAYFTGNERNVRITGQVYFEVANNSGVPFYVNINDQAKVKVIGTHFNISAIAEEPVIKTTLLEGSIKLISNNREVLIKAGQQVQSNTERREFTILSDIDTDEVIAWKNGLFSFNNADIQTIMKQCERWYDVEVDFQGNIPYRFVATISRDVPISKLLKILELTGRVQFKLDGKKITVMP